MTRGAALRNSQVGCSSRSRLRGEREDPNGDRRDRSIHCKRCTEPRLRRELALILAECKNWTSKCGKDEFVIFREKLENRKRRCSLGFLISWNGLTATVTKEMLRGSKEELLIVPMTGQDVRAAVRSGDFLKELVRCWDAAVAL